MEQVTKETKMVYHRSMMNKSSCIRNVTAISHMYAGKTTLSNVLCIASTAQNQSVSDCNSNSNNIRESTMTLKSSGKFLPFTIPSTIEIPKDVEGSELLINWIDSPGHTDLSSEVSASLRLSDGCIILVDVLEGFQNENLVRQALSERVVPSVVLNKLDKVFLDAPMDYEDIYQLCARIVENVNLSLSTMKDKFMGEVIVSPEKSHVGFFSALHGWGFTLNQFAGMYSKKFGLEKSKMAQRLWGDNYFDVEAKKWTSKNLSASGKKLSRSFCQFVLSAIGQLCSAVMSGKQEKLTQILKHSGVVLTDEENLLSGLPLLKVIMQKWLPAHEALIEMALFLPAPSQAQQYRVDNLYTGPQDDITAIAIRSCNPQGPLVMYISKVVTDDNGHFAAFGRVFSGTVVAGSKVRILGPQYQQGRREDLDHETIQNVMITRGNDTQLLDSVPAGNLCSVTGLDRYITKRATITSDQTSFPIAPMRLSYPVMHVAVEPKNPSDLPKIVEALRRLEKSDPIVEVMVEDSGEHTIAGSGEFHLEILLKDMHETFLKGVPFFNSAPIIGFRETVLEESSQICVSKSPNKHNRLWCVAKPLEDSLVAAIDNGEITAHDDIKKRVRTLVEHHGWDMYEARKIWAFGPRNSEPNILLETTRGVQYMNEIKDSITTGFYWATKEGVLAAEFLRGVKFDIIDCILHADAIRRGAGQIIPTARRVCYAAQLTAKPRLMEPIYLIDIQCPSSAIAFVFSVINNRGGHIIEERLRREVAFASVTCYMPVVNSIGLASDLMATTGGQVLSQCVVDHWKVIHDDPMEPGTRAEEIVLDIRKRKGMRLEIPPLATYLDKL